MSKLDEVGERESWRCWLCDEPVDQNMSVNDPRGPSIDSINSARKGKSGPDRLAHRACNTKKGAVRPVVPWPDSLFVIDPAPIIGVVEQLTRKPGRVAVARCPAQSDAEAASSWLLDRLSRLAPDLQLGTTIEPGGGGFLLVLRR